VTLRMHQIRFLPAPCPGPRWGAHDASSNPLEDTPFPFHTFSTPTAPRFWRMRRLTLS